MKLIKCTTSNCEHNIQNKCHAGIINVDEKGNCTTRVKRSGGILAQTFADVEAGDEGAEFSGEAFILCDCKNCAYNKEHKCNANSIQVDDGLTKTKCSTRSKRNK